jgi:acetyl esterase
VELAATLLESQGADTSRLAVGGDSAGGTLAAVCALRARVWPTAACVP